VSELDDLALKYNPSAGGVEFWLKHLQHQCMKPWLIGDDALELGCSTGLSTFLLSLECENVHVVEGSLWNIEQAKLLAPGAKFTHSLWESFNSTTQYPNIVCSGALEHIDEPVALLHKMQQWIAPGGNMHICVPNGLSFHRLLAAEMGLLSDPLELNDSDRAQGHKRNYSIDTLLLDLESANLSPVHVETIFLKPFPADMMPKATEKLYMGLHRMTQLFPRNGAEIYIVANPN
jgi:SAM-dependent methyltransferase